jgi:hypothetical protein
MCSAIQYGAAIHQSPGPLVQTVPVGDFPQIAQIPRYAIDFQARNLVIVYRGKVVC